MAEHPARQLHLSRLRVKNFRSIAALDVPLRPLTVLVGPNGAGKSNIVDALRFLRDCLTRGLDQALLDRGGFEAVRRWVGSGHKPDVQVGVSYAAEVGLDQISYELTLTFSAKKLAVRREEVATTGFGLPDFRLVREADTYTLYEDGSAVSPNQAHGSLAQLASGGLAGPNGLALAAYLRYNELPATDQVSPVWRSLMRLFRLLVSELGNSLTRPLFYTLNPVQLRLPQQLVKEAPLDEAGQNLAAVLRQLRRDKQVAEELRLVLGRVSNGLTDFSVSTAGSYLVGYLYYSAADGKNRRADLGQESDGTLRVLGLLAALYQSIPQDATALSDNTETLPFIAIEEPEVHVHPGVLAVLAELFMGASRRKQLLLTTHSPDLLDYLPPESFLVVEKVDGATQAGLLDPVQLEVARQQLFSPGELLRAQGLHRAPDDAPASL